MARRLAILVLVAAACATGGVRPGTGDLAFRLVWQGEADLDLYVVSPARERVDFLNRRVPSGGRLDVDCNVRGLLVDPESGERTDRICTQPMENVFWPRGQAADGIYRYWVHLANPQGLDPADGWRLDVLLRGRVVRSHQGAVDELRERTYQHELELPLRRADR